MFPIVQVDSGGELQELVEKFKASILQISSIENVESNQDASGEFSKMLGH